MRISDWSSDVCSSDLNKLVQPGAVSVDGTPIDLRKVNTPSYVQAGREDHIAPPESVWKVTEHFAGPLRFVLAGSGHIAGVVNPPAADRKSVVSGKSVSVRVDLGGRRIIKKKNTKEDITVQKSEQTN